ncbi:MAG: type II toxin-antitoxin system VapC family toxin [bacterium]|nr:type II toxin-antitoxin system VapC family toxin [bacterium]
MPTYTVDASVFVNAFQAHEEGHEASRGMLASMHEEAVQLIVPTLLFAEIAGAVARGCDDSDLGRDFADTVSRLPNLLSVSLDRRLASQASALAAEHRLRGSDAVYAAVASRFGSVLVTRDREQRRRLSNLLETRRPEEVDV